MPKQQQQDQGQQDQANQQQQNQQQSPSDPSSGPQPGTGPADAGSQSASSAPSSPAPTPPAPTTADQAAQKDASGGNSRGPTTAAEHRERERAHRTAMAADIKKYGSEVLTPAEALEIFVEVVGRKPERERFSEVSALFAQARTALPAILDHDQRTRAQRHDAENEEDRLADAQAAKLEG